MTPIFLLFYLHTHTQTHMVYPLWILFSVPTTSLTYTNSLKSLIENNPVFPSWWSGLYPCLLGYIFFFEKERKRETNLLFHLLLHSLIASYMCPDWDQTCSLGVSGWFSNQLSYAARAHLLLAAIQVDDISLFLETFCFPNLHGMKLTCFSIIYHLFIYVSMCLSIII